jgi:hypothetical protein
VAETLGNSDQTKSVVPLVVPFDSKTAELVAIWQRLEDDQRLKLTHLANQSKARNLVQTQSISFAKSVKFVNRCGFVHCKK